LDEEGLEGINKGKEAAGGGTTNVGVIDESKDICVCEGIDFNLSILSLSGLFVAKTGIDKTEDFAPP